GGCARYGAGLLINANWRDAFPLGTFTINVIGSFLIGALASWLSDTAPDATQNAFKLLLMVGLCGGFTTFSSFSLETLNLLRNGQTTIALGYIAASVVLCVVATAIGYSFSRSSL
ncbi:MAG: fluoride efflux transporter CrcB, partial [Alphaproteobacteria bacterium]|nr:fluoride efflux transporter CrcB [Alphaproteobacteria bacterium]